MCSEMNKDALNKNYMANVLDQLLPRALVQFRTGIGTSFSLPRIAMFSLKKETENFIRQ